MTYRTDPSPRRARRRPLPLLVAALLTAVTTLAGVTVTAAPAQAEPASCSFDEYDSDGGRWADLDTAGQIWLFTWVDGVFRGWSLLSEQTVRIDAVSLQQVGGTSRLEYRAYPYGIDQTAVTYDTEWLCETGFVKPAPQGQQLTFHPLETRRVGGTQELSATSDSGLPVSFESATPGICAVTGRTVTAQAVGQCGVRATQPGGAEGSVDYDAADPVLRDFAVWPAPVAQSIDFAQPTEMRVSDEAQSLDVSATSQLHVVLQTLTPEVCAAHDGRLGRVAGAGRAPTPGASVDPIRTGVCTVRAVQPGNADWDWLENVHLAAEPVERSFLIRPDVTNQTITFPALSDMRLGDDDQKLDATASSGLWIDYESTTPAVCTIPGHHARMGTFDARPTAVRAKAPGTCTVVASQPGWDGGDHDYAAAEPVSRSFRVIGSERPQTITVRRNQGVALSSRTAPVAFVSSAGRPVTVTSTTPRVCSWTGGQARVLRAGTCSLTASATAGGEHLAAKPVRASFAVWGAPTLPKRSHAARVLPVLGRGEGTLRVSARPAGVCGAVAGKVALTDAGTCTITVTRGGTKVRSARVAVVELKTRAPKPADMTLAGSVRFDYRSAVLDRSAKAALRRLAPRLRNAKLVAVYGNTQAFGAGDTPANRKLSRQRAAAVVSFLRDRGVRAKTTKVALASRNPAGKDEAANRRADIYWVR